MAATAIAGPLISTKTERTAPQVSSINHAWLNELGRAEINLGKTAGKSLHGEVALLFPLQQDQQQLLFTQGNWRRSQGDTTLNLGVGQRWFNATAGYWGYNLFYDYQLQGHHQRLGLGVELRKNRLSWTLNGYLPLSAQRGGDHQANTVRPAQGVDLRLQYQPLQQPHWRFTLKGERYFGHTLAESDKSLCHNRSAVTAGVDYTPWPLITAGYGYQLGSGRQRTHQWQLTLTYRLGIPLAQQLDPQQVAAAHSLAGGRLALVQRNHQILLEQQPNDTIQLELQPELRGKIGTQQTVTFRLHSPCPRDEWTLAWQGDLLAHTEDPQINGAADQATLILPNCPGTYTLQLQAHNARNQKGSSNQMRIIAEEWPVAGKTGEDLLPQDKAPSQSLQEKNSPHILPLEPQGKITDPTRPVEADSVGSESVELDSGELDAPEQIQLPENSYQQDLTSELETADNTPRQLTEEDKIGAFSHPDNPATPSEEDYKNIGALPGDNNTQVKKKWHIKLNRLKEEIAKNSSEEEKEVLKQEAQAYICSLQKVKAYNSDKRIESLSAGISYSTSVPPPGSPKEITDVDSTVKSVVPPLYENNDPIFKFYMKAVPILGKEASCSRETLYFDLTPRE